MVSETFLLPVCLWWGCCGATSQQLINRKGSLAHIPASQLVLQGSGGFRAYSRIHLLHLCFCLLAQLILKRFVLSQEAACISHQTASKTLNVHSKKDLTGEDDKRFQKKFVLQWHYQGKELVRKKKIKSTNLQWSYYVKSCRLRGINIPNDILRRLITYGERKEHKTAEMFYL